MSLRKTGICVGAALLGWTSAAMALPKDYETGFQTANSPVMVWIEGFHHELLIIITAVCVFVALLLLWIMVRYRAGANPTPSKVHHNTLLEVAWTIIPVIILVVIAIPSFKLLYYEAAPPHAPDVTIEAIGHQWYWSYQYPGAKAGFGYDSLGLSDEADKKAGKPRLLGVDNIVVVPVGKIVEIDTTGSDVIHSWALPQMGVKMDAVPGRINKTWFQADHVGTYYGQCSELCGARHAFMPIEVKVVPEPEYEGWLAAARKSAASGKGPYTALDTAAK
ncbi:MAG TPA: cytochrome c oxidase subunit II [Rhizomicrobium sp.]